ncbi:MAG: hypothetical protein K2N87_13425 [Eubacterium sp.]|nr:hypothetical protein [Eubacterium sp.]
MKSWQECRYCDKNKIMQDGISRFANEIEGHYQREFSDSHKTIQFVVPHLFRNVLDEIRKQYWAGRAFDVKIWDYETYCIQAWYQRQGESTQILLQKEFIFLQAKENKCYAAKAVLSTDGTFAFYNWHRNLPSTPTGIRQLLFKRGVLDEKAPKQRYVIFVLSQDRKRIKGIQTYLAENGYACEQMQEYSFCDMPQALALTRALAVNDCFA